jgi:glucose/arabinose dehydrogenase
MDVAANGDLFIAENPGGGRPGGVIVLRDEDGDGQPDREERWGDRGGNDVLLHEGWVYISPNDAVLRYPIEAGSMTPSGPPQVVVSGLPSDGSHAPKSVAIDAAGSLFVNIGSRSNICTPRGSSDGPDPCPELDIRAGIWRFDPNRADQTQADGVRFASGVRNAVGLAIHPTDGLLYAMQHGRDSLDELFPALFTEEAGNELPSEEFIVVSEGDDFGWPYCFYDHRQGKKVLGPEYGGDGMAEGRCADAADPLIGFPGHWAPNDLEFYDGTAFPTRFQGGAFIAFHGSWNRTPLQQGFQVAFVPMSGGTVSGDWETFADGFATAPVTGGRGGRASRRPVGVATAPDGSLYISDSVSGRIWKIVYQGS